MSFQKLGPRAFVYRDCLWFEVGLETSLEHLGEVWIG
jgi:hypothetical protein